MQVRSLLRAETLIKSLAIGAGLVILAVGIAIAQPAPGAPPAGARPTAAAILEQCRGEIAPALAGQERREAMRRCVEAKREAAGLNQRADLKQQREANLARRQAERRECREEVREQRLTDAERRDAIAACIARKDPRFAKTQSCRKEAEAKQLAPRSAPFREFMRGCVRAT